MSEEGQRLTREHYSDPQIVTGYIELNAKNPKLSETVESFAETLPGKRIVDIGCGPGHDSWKFAELGFKVTALDYSTEMIKAAKRFRPNHNPPEFRIADMRDVGSLFPENSFDGAWVSASLLHIPEEDVPGVLKGIHKIVVNGGRVYIGLKSGIQGAQIVSETKYLKPIQREFIFWEKQNFQKLAETLGFKTVDFTETGGGTTGGKPTAWLNFFFEIEKH